MSSDDHTGRDWVVLLEAAGERGATIIEPTSFARMVSAWATPAPTTLYSPDRYALQVPLRATNPPLALSSAIALWKDALRRSGLPEWELVRAEVLTPQELEAECQAAERADGGGDTSSPSPPSTVDVVGDALLRDALHDSLTGLPHRELFIDVVRRALASGGPASATQAVMVVHLDALDVVEPSRGRSVPDDVLAEIAARLREVVRRADVVARVGPAEFALLIEAASVSDTDRLARRIADQFRCPLAHEGEPVNVTASIGVATASSGGNADQLMGMAEVAMVAAMEAGGDCHKHFAASEDTV